MGGKDLDNDESPDNTWRRGQRSNKKPGKNHPKFEDHYEEIARVVKSNLFRWRLGARSDIDRDDVFSLIINHIWTKWHLYNPKRPLANWCNVVAQHQIKNLLRNYYYRFTKPCDCCSAAESTPELPDGCKIYGQQCEKCPLFAKWKNKTEQAFNVNLPTSSAYHENEIISQPSDSFNLEEGVQLLCDKLKLTLTEDQYRVFDNLFLKGMTEAECGREMGYKTTNGVNAQRQIKTIKETIISKTKMLMKNGGLFDE